METAYTVKMVPQIDKDKLAQEERYCKYKWDSKNTRYLSKPFGFDEKYILTASVIKDLEEAKQVAQFNNDMYAIRPKPYFGVVEIELDDEGRPKRILGEVH